MDKTENIQELTITLTDKYKTFTDQLHEIVFNINEGHTLGDGWSLQPEGNEINLSWHIDDVKSIASDLTDAECREVLQAVKHNHDATIGVSWDTLEFWANVVRQERSEKESKKKK